MLWHIFVLPFKNTWTNILVIVDELGTFLLYCILFAFLRADESFDFAYYSLWAKMFASLVQIMIFINGGLIVFSICFALKDLRKLCRKQDHTETFDYVESSEEESLSAESLTEKEVTISEDAKEDVVVESLEEIEVDKNPETAFRIDKKE